LVQKKTEEQDKKESIHNCYLKLLSKIFKTKSKNRIP